MKDIKRLAAVSKRECEADLVLKDAFVFHTFSGRFFSADIAVSDGYIAGIGSYRGRRELNFEGKYITPGFIDACSCMEKAFLSPMEFSRTVVPFGTTSAVVDVQGLLAMTGNDGLMYLMECTRAIPLSFHFLLSKKYSKNVDLQQMCTADARRIHREFDFACESGEQILTRMHAGAYTALCESNLAECLEYINSYTERLCLFATGEVETADLLGRGHVNHLVREAIMYGYRMETALQMATLYPAQAFQLEDVGAIAPGYKADLLVFDDLKTWRPTLVFKDGIKVAEQRKALFCGSDFLAAAKEPLQKEFNKLRECAALPNKLESKVYFSLNSNPLRLDLVDEEQFMSCDREREAVKVAFVLVEGEKIRIVSGFLKGCGLREGAIAMSGGSGHLAIAVGTSDQELLFALSFVGKMQGGIVVVKEGQELVSLLLPLLGSMTNEGVHYVDTQLSAIRMRAHDLGFRAECGPVWLLQSLSAGMYEASRG